MGGATGDPVRSDACLRLIATLADRYRIDCKLGQGGMACLPVASAASSPVRIDV